MSNAIATAVDKAGPIASGYNRQWVRCKQCGDIAYYDYVPYSLSDPIRCLPCCHGAGQRFEDSVDRISELEAVESKGKEPEE